MPLVRAWMQSTADAPRWSEADLALAVAAGSASAGRERRGWALLDAHAELAGFLIAAALRAATGPAECELEFAFVLPRLRRSGAGLVLLDRLLAWADDLKAGEIWLEVRASNRAARGLYAACGFIEAGLRPGYYLDPPDDAVLMRREIEHPAPDAPV